LLDWMLARPEVKVRGISPRDILRTGPAPLRKMQRRDAAIGILVETANVIEDKASGGTIYRPNPKLLGPNHERS
jgi:hypothetical protein